jgi:hypothetical protein
MSPALLFQKPEPGEPNEADAERRRPIVVSGDGAKS